jgi:hypothetical protein
LLILCIGGKKKKRTHSGDKSRSRSKSGKRNSKLKNSLKSPSKSISSSKILKYGALTPSSIRGYVNGVKERKARRQEKFVSWKNLKKTNKVGFILNQ